MDERMRRARAALNDLTPLITDCGALCGAACCQTDENGQGGVYLFPSETADEFAAWGHVEQDDFAPMLMCDAPCDREHRPFACRIFPLTPVKKDGAWTVRLDIRARPLCPLCRSGIRGLNPDFVKAARRAVRIIAESPEGEAYLTRWSALEEEYRLPFE